MVTKYASGWVFVKCNPPTGNKKKQPSGEQKNLFDIRASWGITLHSACTRFAVLKMWNGMRRVFYVDNQKKKTKPKNKEGFLILLRVFRQPICNKRHFKGIGGIYHVTKENLLQSARWLLSKRRPWCRVRRSRSALPAWKSIIPQLRDYCQQMSGGKVLIFHRGPGHVSRLPWKFPNTSVFHYGAFERQVIGFCS